MNIQTLDRRDSRYCAHAFTGALPAGAAGLLGLAPAASEDDDGAAAVALLGRGGVMEERRPGRPALSIEGALGRWDWEGCACVVGEVLPESPEAVALLLLAMDLIFCSRRAPGLPPEAGVPER